MSQFSEMKSGAEMRDHIIGKAADDAAFRTRLVADPKGILTEEFGVSLPDSFAISVYEDSGTHVTLGAAAEQRTRCERIEGHYRRT